MQIALISVGGAQLGALAGIVIQGCLQRRQLKNNKARVEEIHVLVNDRLTKALEKIEELKENDQ